MPGFAIASPTYQPAMRLVTAVTNASTAVVTTSFDHDYLVGLIVRVYVPSEWKMFQIDRLVGTIIAVPTDDTFTIDIDTTNFDTFVVPAPEPWYINNYAMVVPVGSLSASINQATRNVL